MLFVMARMLPYL